MSKTNNPPLLVLASTSLHRRQLLARLQIPFAVAAPVADETPIAGEPPDARALRLAEEKARSLAAAYPDGLIIGGDQTICGDGVIFDKPQTKARAVKQLAAMRQCPLSFFTAVAVLDVAAATMCCNLVTHRVRMRAASDEEILRYVEKETATNCAGGAQIEGLGIALMEEIEGGDPTALIGLPLMSTAKMLRDKGLQIP